ncbi:MAG TPA: NAD(P)-dependent oxidoreductase [Yinghuangia sp.]|nr:NAD(P)-dependent oxidoreductase [Yinghuangia sp.]
MSTTTVGFIGLGNMGGELANNLVKHGLPVIAHDAAGPERVPEGATAAADVAEVARQADVIVLSLPDGKVSEIVARNIVGAADRRTRHIIDTSTTGVGAAQRIEALLAENGIGLLDAPVSGGTAGARARTLMVMYAGNDETCEAVAPVIAGLSDRNRRVGDRPGMAQALKLANNFLSATALAATSEAIAFGLSVGLDMKTMLDVMSASSGANTATTDKFPNHVLTGTYASGFANSLMSKDINLFLESVREQGSPSEVGELTAAIWARFAAAEPGVDFTRIFPFVEGS